MAINATEEQRQKQLASDLANKLALEPRLARDLSVIFRDVADLYQAELQTTGSVIDVSDFEVDIRAALKAQYRRVNRRFGRQLRRQLKGFMADIEVKTVDDDITKEQNEFMNDTSAEHALLIIATLQRQLNQIPVLITDAAIAESPLAAFEPLSPEELAKQSADKFRSMIPNKSSVISETETQVSAEGLKFIEANLLSENDIIKISKKEWAAVLDERTRLSHANADGQRQNHQDPFIVQGQSLMFPGDTNLGATADNVIRCRCSSLTIVV